MYKNNKDLYDTTPLLLFFCTRMSVRMASSFKLCPFCIGLNLNTCLKQIFDIQDRYASEASVVQWLCHSPCKPGVAGSISGFSSLLDGTINEGPVSI